MLRGCKSGVREKVEFVERCESRPGEDIVEQVICCRLNELGLGTSVEDKCLREGGREINIEQGTIIVKLGLEKVSIPRGEYRDRIWC